MIDEKTRADLMEYRLRLVGEKRQYVERPWWRLPRWAPGYRYGRFVDAELDRVDLALGMPGAVHDASWWMEP